MKLILAIIYVLKNYSSQDIEIDKHPMKLKEVHERVYQFFHDGNDLSMADKDKPGTIFPTRRQVQYAMEEILEYEAHLNFNERTIFYKTRSDGNKTDYYYKDNSFTNYQLKFLIDSALNSRFINPEESNEVAEKISKLAGKDLKSITAYLPTFGNLKTSQSVDVFSNMRLLNEAIEHNRKVSFKLNVYQTDLNLHTLDKVHEVNPHYIIMGNNKYYLIATYNGTDKCYYHRIDLMSNIKILDIHKTMDTNSYRELKDGYNIAKYINEHPYMIGGEVRNIELKVDKYYFTHIVDWFGTNIKVLKETETETTINVIVRASVNAMQYWLLQYGEIVEAVNVNNELRKKLKHAAEIIYKKYAMLNDNE